MAKEYGIHPNPDGSWEVIWPSAETRDKRRSITIPSPAVEVILQSQHVQTEVALRNVTVEASTRSRREIAHQVVEQTPGIKFGGLITTILDELGIDTESEGERKRTGGMLNSEADAGKLFRDDSDRWWPAEVKANQ